MDIEFKSKKLEKMCNCEKALTKKFGDAVGKKIARTLGFIDSSPCLEDISHNPPHKRHELKGKMKGKFAIDAAGRGSPIRIIFEPNHDPVPIKQDGGNDLQAITAIKILEIGDYHDG